MMNIDLTTHFTYVFVFSVVDICEWS